MKKRNMPKRYILVKKQPFTSGNSDSLISVGKTVLLGKNLSLQLQKEMILTPLKGTTTTVLVVSKQIMQKMHTTLDHNEPLITFQVKGAHLPNSIRWMDT